MSPAEGAGLFGEGRGEAPHVVPAHAGADDQHALIAQRRERAAGGEVLGGIEVGLQRELHDGGVGVRGDQLQRHEDPVVVAALRVGGGGQAGLG